MSLNRATRDWITRQIAIVARGELPPILAALVGPKPKRIPAMAIDTEGTDRTEPAPRRHARAGKE